ncbi:hypothetical protein BU25DRAFT_407898 [Macroventuria anomochaeta]|uniref:Uncharacterized protein n=1 Tax=Macroventuria anomochaeta TaxID=301207 RepID=A0ACB6SBY1_9PLEO|nr:uncharacterized protein BU25DRAFT_407898 [Macroventuria anomochaeta]KAF2630607.1 hypothetical protein BU25DRAFT_407898 [Macroventuria anomochaeta]
MGLIHHVARQDHGNQEFPPSFLAQSRQPQMIIGNIVVQAVGSLFFFARAYSRVAIIKAWRGEDYILMLAWVFCTGYSVCQYGQIDNGAGRHAIATSMENPQAPITSQKYAYAAQIILLPALALSKLSICLTYLRIFYTDKRGRYMIQALMVLLFLLIVPFMFEVAFQCRPIHVYWTEGRPAAKCLQDLPGFLLSGSLNIVVDVALMAIVLPRVLELQLHQRQKWALTGIVLLGSLAVVAGIVRMVRVSGSITMPNFEPSWDSYDVSIWTSTEIYVSLLCASAPGVKPAVVKILPKLLGSSFSRSRTQTAGRTSTGIELGLRSKWKRTTIGSTRINNRRLSETGLTTADGPYTEVGSGVSARSLSRKSEDRPTTATSEGKSSHGGHIYKTSEISIQTHAI